MKVIARAFDGARMVNGPFLIDASTGQIRPVGDCQVTKQQEPLLCTWVYDDTKALIFEHDLLEHLYPDGRKVVGVVVFETGAFYVKLKNEKYSYLPELIPPALRYAGKPHTAGWKVIGTIEENESLFTDVPEKELIHEIIEVLPNNWTEEDLTADGKVKVKAIEMRIDKEISEQDRDDAWERFRELFGDYPEPLLERDEEDSESS